MIQKHRLYNKISSLPINLGYSWTTSGTRCVWRTQLLDQCLIHEPWASELKPHWAPTPTSVQGIRCVENCNRLHECTEFKTYMSTQVHTPEILWIPCCILYILAYKVCKGKIILQKSLVSLKKSVSEKVQNYALLCFSK